MKLSRNRVEAEILAQVTSRGKGKTICPSEVARVLDDDWRSLMDEVRSAAAGLAQAGLIDVTQGGKPVDPLVASGPIRLGLR